MQRELAVDVVDEQLGDGYAQTVRTRTLAYHPQTLVMLAGPAGLGAAAAAWYLQK